MFQGYRILASNLLEEALGHSEAGVAERDHRVVA
jgi:hypothetical protein